MTDKMVELQPSQYQQIFAGMEVRQILTFKAALHNHPEIEYDHAMFNECARERFASLAQQYDARLTASIHCINRGHDWHVRSQRAHDEGFDEPMVCWRCGAWDM
jgi:hypothetical protein